MTDTKDYLALARSAVAQQVAAEAEARVQAHAAALKAADEREVARLSQCYRYRLDPATATPRQLSDCWMAEEVAFKDYVVHRHGHLAPHILGDVPLADAAPQWLVGQVAAARQSVRADFEKQYVPAPLQPGEIDSAQASRAHNTVAA
jgi:hypothetical protein